MLSKLHKSLFVFTINAKMAILNAKPIGKVNKTTLLRVATANNRPNNSNDGYK